MAEELSRITRPATANYQGKRKLLLAPLIHLAAPPDAIPPEGADIVARYWEQVDVQVRAVQNALGTITHVYHESLPEGGDAGLGYLAATNQDTHQLVTRLVEAGATLEATESMEIMAEALDLQRCLMQPLMSMDVVTRLQEWFTDTTRRRYDFISSSIDASLGEDEAGLLLINERHQAQFPGEIEVIYVAPPALDEFRRWAQNWSEQLQRQMSEPAGPTSHAEDPASPL